MRKVVAYEGRETPDGRTILPNALVVAEPAIPATLHLPGRDAPRLIGYAADMLRDEAGSISFDIVIDDVTQVKDHTPMIYLSNVKGEVTEDLVSEIHQGTIREICYVKGPNAWGETFE